MLFFQAASITRDAFAARKRLLLELILRNCDESDNKTPALSLHSVLLQASIAVRFSSCMLYVLWTAASGNI